ncbi:unnamed protein product, partial [Ectocarpus sp. 13 AM-2016]
KERGSSERKGQQDPASTSCKLQRPQLRWRRQTVRHWVPSTRQPVGPTGREAKTGTRMPTSRNGTESKPTTRVVLWI